MFLQQSCVDNTTSLWRFEYLTDYKAEWHILDELEEFKEQLLIHLM
jgi:hypothetical protein